MMVVKEEKEKDLEQHGDRNTKTEKVELKLVTVDQNCRRKINKLTK